ncbi:MAG: arginine deiminase-related protein [Acidobacteriota bacterium]|nr:arginine deiminase-related protein [Acidobacteriota bacterium]MDH3531133.1 arginine deiminase-related protein [Acidobacteriota bacterium]
MFLAITRKPAVSVSNCELTFLKREPVDYKIALSQHDAYERILEKLGCRVISLPAKEDYPDSVFVEDTAVILPEVAVLMSPGAESRRGEVDLIEPLLAKYRETVRIQPPAYIDGGDVLTIGKKVFVGQSTRTNGAGVMALREIVRRFGYSVFPVKVTGALHLKSACAALDDKTLLVNPEWLDVSHFKEFRILEVREPFASDCLHIEETIVLDESFVETIRLVRKSGFKVETIDVSEFGKMEAGLTCLSLIFDAA